MLVWYILGYIGENLLSGQEMQQKFGEITLYNKKVDYSYMTL